MVQTVKEPIADNLTTIWGKFYTINPTPRVEKLRQRYLKTKNQVAIDIARLRTQSAKETEGEPRVIRQAKAFAAIVRGIPTNIYPDELFVGWLFSFPRGTEIPFNSLSQMALWMENELDSLSTRKSDPFLITEEDKKVLREEIYPYWKKHFYNPWIPPEAKKFGIENARLSERVCHYVVNYEKVLQKGLLGVKQQAENRLNRLELMNPEDVKKVPFLEGVIIAMEAATEIGDRFAAKAKLQGRVPF